MNSLKSNFFIYQSALLAQSKLLNIPISSDNPIKQDIQIFASVASAIESQIAKHISPKIKIVPTFFEPQVERPELSEETKETFARIGARARREFIEEQTARAFQYNIPFNLEHVDFFKLEQQIDEYEELLSQAREQGISWDISQYDPVALKQAIDEQESYYRQERNDLYGCFSSTRGLEA